MKEYEITSGNTSVQNVSGLNTNTSVDGDLKTKVGTLFQGPTIRSKNAALLLFTRKVDGVASSDVCEGWKRVAEGRIHRGKDRWN